MISIAVIAASLSDLGTLKGESRYSMNVFEKVMPASSTLICMGDRPRELGYALLAIEYQLQKL